jgi:hypothetical protein
MKIIQEMCYQDFCGVKCYKMTFCLWVKLLFCKTYTSVDGDYMIKFKVDKKNRIYVIKDNLERIYGKDGG